MAKPIFRFYIDGWDKLPPERRKGLMQRASNANPGQQVQGADSKEIIRADYGNDWYDTTLEADHWFAMATVAPVDAALLLCHNNPNETTFDKAKCCTNGQIGPKELIQLHQRFVALQATDSDIRTLVDWIEAARSMGLKYHSWIDGYRETALVQEGNSASDESQVDDTLLATHEELLGAFGKWGLKKTWFDDLNSHKWLFNARKRVGQGKNLKPLFCPFTVMEGMIHNVRKKNRLRDITAWRTLEHKFPVVYAVFEDRDPREPTGC